MSTHTTSTQDLPAPEEEQEFADLYRQLVEEEFGTAVVAPAELIPFTEQLVLEAEGGDVPHRGRLHHITPAGVDPTDPAAIRAGVAGGGGLPRWAVLAGMLAGPLLLGYLLVGLLDPAPPAPRTRPTPLPTVLQVGATAPAAGTPAPTATLAPPPPVAAGFVTVGGQQLPDLRPNTLELGGRSFLVYVAPVKDGNWQVSHAPDVANWLPGATANWAFALFLAGGVEPADGPWLATLGPGRVVTLRVTADSRAHRFVLRTRQVIGRTQTEYLDPHQPGLTIALQTQPESDTRLLLQGSEEIAVAAGATVGPTAGIVAPLTPAPGTTLPGRR